MQLQLESIFLSIENDSEGKCVGLSVDNATVKNRTLNLNYMHVSKVTMYIYFAAFDK